VWFTSNDKNKLRAVICLCVTNGKQVFKIHLAENVLANLPQKKINHDFLRTQLYFYLFIFLGWRGSKKSCQRKIR
jgi:hypothetical protein